VIAAETPILTPAGRSDRRGRGAARGGPASAHRWTM